MYLATCVIKIVIWQVFWVTVYNMTRKVSKHKYKILHYFIGSSFVFHFFVLAEAARYKRFSGYYHTIDLYQPWKIACGRADITLAIVYSVSDGRLCWCRQRATASPICKHRSRRSIILPFSKVIFKFLTYLGGLHNKTRYVCLSVCFKWPAERLGRSRPNLA